MFDSDEAVDALCEAVGRDGPAAWTVFDRADGDPDGFDLRPDPVDLVGWRAPVEAWAIGMVAGGTARVIDERGLTSERCQVACVVDRWGAPAARVRYTDGRELHEGPQAGRALDVLRRCVGLDTPPPQEPLAEVLHMVWLVAVAVSSHRRARPLRWADAIALHPVVRLLDPATSGWSARAGSRGADVGAARRPGDPIASVVVDRLADWSWADVRMRCVADNVTLADITPDLADWMDDGMFSRWLAEAHADVEMIVDAGFDALMDEDHPALGRLLIGATGAPDEPPGTPTRRFGRCGVREPRWP